LEVIAVLHYNDHDGVIHACVLKACVNVFYQSKCISAIKRILSTTAMYISSSSFKYLFISCCYDACLKSSALRVGVTKLHTWGQSQVVFLLQHIRWASPKVQTAFFVPTW